MNRISTRVSLALLSTMVSLAAMPQSHRPIDQSRGMIDLELSPSAHHSSLGIVGNGIDGIVGNGILQRITPEHLIINDRVYITGPGSIGVMIDFQNASLDQIGPGHVVEVGAYRSSDSADQNYAPHSITLDSLMRGQVQAVGAGDSPPTITLLNQIIPLQNYSLIFAGSTEIEVDEIQTGDIVTVHGWLDHTGTPVVTRVDRLDGISSDTEISGPVTSIDASSARLQINDLTVDFSGANFLYIEPDDLTIGQHLEVAGAFFIDDTLNASTIRSVVLNPNIESKQEFDLVGILTATDTFELSLSGLSIL